MFVTGTVTAQTNGNGIVSGFKIDHNTGNLVPIIGLPISSGGANPGRAVLLNGSRFLYVLNRGTTASGGSNCTTANPCQNSNITQFAVGGNGVLTPQETFYTQGINPFRILGDSSGSYLLVLDHDSPSSAACALALGKTVTSCADVTVFAINGTTGRLTLVVNAQVTASNGQALTYFPVPANPIDMILSTGTLLTLSGTPATGDSVFPYTYSGSSGQLTISQNTAQPLGIFNATAIINGSGTIYVLDNEPPSPNSTGAFSQLLPFTEGSNGALQAQTGGAIPEDPTLANPVYLLVAGTTGKFLYVANAGNNVSGPNPAAGINGYFITTSPSYQLTPTAPATFGTGSGPVCMVEDPSNQFIYVADYNDSAVSGRVIDPNSGVLNNLRVASSFTLQGPAAWCLVDGRTS
jgi:hypothetical protein